MIFDSFISLRKSAGKYSCAQDRENPPKTWPDYSRNPPEFSRLVYEYPFIGNQAGPDGKHKYRFERVDGFNNRRLSETIGNYPPAGLEIKYYLLQKELATEA